MKPVLTVRRGLLAAVTLICAQFQHASGQCKWWDASVGPIGPYPGILDLRALDIGSGPQLFRAYNPNQGRVDRWTGTSWVLAGNGGFDDYVFCVESYDSGTGPQLWAGGQFTTTVGPHPANGLARLVNGTWWSAGLPAFGPAFVSALAVFDDGSGPKLYAGGGFDTSSQLNSDSFVKWDGTVWRAGGDALTGVPPYGPGVYSMCVFDDGTGAALYVGGTFLTAGGIAVNHIAKWNGTNWSALGSGMTFPGHDPVGVGVNAMTVFDDGAGLALYVCGVFDHAGGVPANSIAKWDGSGWSALPGLTYTTFVSLTAITVHDDGNGPALYAGLNPHAFIGESLAKGVARWDGQGWSSLGGGFGGAVYALQSFDDGQGGGPALWVGGNNTLYVGGNLPPVDLARWYGGCTQGIEPMCFGDGTFALCPCANYGSSLHGCSNSASNQGALLSATGTTTPDTLALQSSFEPATCLSIFVQSSTLLPVQVAFGDGILCLGGQLRRMYVKTSSAGVAQAPEPGDPSITQVSAMLGDPIAPGSIRYYQVWYRDGEPTFCTPASFNVSNGLRVVW